VDEVQSQREVQTTNEAKIVQSDEFKFFLHRHWNLYDSMLHSSYVASRLGVWKTNGKKKLGTLLVEMGKKILGKF
jgi:cell division control protein 45